MRCEAAGKPAPFVEIEAGEYFLEMLMEAGPVKSGTMGGSEGLDWVDLTAYFAGYDFEVEHEDRVLLRKMSQAFANGLSEGTNPFSIAPVDRVK